MKKLPLAGELLRDERTIELEKQSLAGSLAALRRRKHQRRLVQWGLSAAAASFLLTVGLLFQAPSSPELAREASIGSTLVVHTRPLPEGVAFNSRSTVQPTITSQSASLDLDAGNGSSESAVTLVSSRPSAHIEFLTNQQLQLALAGRAIILRKPDEDEWELLFFDGSEKELLPGRDHLDQL